MHFKKSLIALCLVALASISSASAQTPAAPQAAAVPPVISLKALDGKLYDTAEMRGDVVVASFGATWCVPCVWELKAVEELVEEYRGKPVRFLWVSIESKERTSDALLKNYAKTYRLTIPVLRDEDGSAFAQFSPDSRRIPLVVFFDAAGKFVGPAQRGMSSDPILYKEKVRARVNALLAAREAQPVESAK